MVGMAACAISRDGPFGGSRDRLRPAVLMYHRIASDSFDPWGLAVSPQRFRTSDRMAAARARCASVGNLREATHRRHAAAPGGRNHLRRCICTDDTSRTAVAGRAKSARDGVHPSRAGLRPASFLVGRARENRARLCSVRNPVDGKNVSVPDPLEADVRWPAGDPPSTPRQRLYLSLWSTLRPRNPSEIAEFLDAARIRGRFRHTPTMRTSR